METSEAPITAPPKVEPSPEHRWLQRLAGDWTFTVEQMMGLDPAAPPHTGTETVRGLGELWVVARGQSNMGDQPDMSLMTLGYDPARGRFVGTFVGPLMAQLWVYEGQLDAAQRVLTLDTEGPSFTGDGSTAPYQDLIELIGDDERTLTSRAQGPDGEWQQLMTMRYRRTG